MTPIERDPSRGLNSEVAAVLRAERAAMHVRLTQDEIAERADIPVVSLRRYLNGKRSIDVSILAAICDAMSIDPATVMSVAAARLAEGEVFDLEAARERHAAVSGAEVNLADLYDEPSAAQPLRADVEGDEEPERA